MCILLVRSAPGWLYCIPGNIQPKKHCRCAVCESLPLPLSLLCSAVWRLWGPCRVYYTNGTQEQQPIRSSNRNRDSSSGRSSSSNRAALKLFIPPTLPLQSWTSTSEMSIAHMLHIKLWPCLSVFVQCCLATLAIAPRGGQDACWCMGSSTRLMQLDVSSYI